MRTFQLPTSGAGIDALAKVDLPQPKTGRRQVLVKVMACSLNYRDVGIATGKYRMPVKPNIIPLSDGAGEVVEVGADVTRVKAGDRVAGCFFQRWPGGAPSPDGHVSALGGGTDGMLTEFALLEDEGVVKLPPHLSYEEGATLPCAALTAWHALVEHGKLIAGQSVLVQGTGGVSTFALQLGRLMGLEVVATSSSDNKLAHAKAIGATHGVNYKTTPEWDKAVMAATGGVDHVVEIGGPGTLAKSLGSIRVGGKVTLIGSAFAPGVDINPMLFLAKRANVQGISVGSTQMFEAMNRAITIGKLKPVIDKVFPFDEAPAAYRYMQSAQHFGKIVIKVG